MLACLPAYLRVPAGSPSGIPGGGGGPPVQARWAWPASIAVRCR